MPLMLGGAVSDRLFTSLRVSLFARRLLCLRCLQDVYSDLPSFAIPPASSLHFLTIPLLLYCLLFFFMSRPPAFFRALFHCLIIYSPHLRPPSVLFLHIF